MYCPNCGKELKNKICEGCKNETVVTITSSVESEFGMKSFRGYTDGRIDAQMRPTGTEFATVVSP